MSQLYSKPFSDFPSHTKQKPISLQWFTGPHKHSDLNSTTFPLVHSASVSLASFLFLRHIWLRTLAMTVPSACKTLPPENWLNSLPPICLPSNSTSFSVRPIFITLINSINFPLHSQSPLPCSVFSCCMEFSTFNLISCS